MAETTHFTFKRIFGEHSLSRTLENIVKETVALSTIYNLIINL